MGGVRWVCLVRWCQGVHEVGVGGLVAHLLSPLGALTLAGYDSMPSMDVFFMLLDTSFAKSQITCILG